MESLLHRLESRGQAVLGRQHLKPTPWLTERYGHVVILVNDEAKKDNGEVVKIDYKRTLNNLYHK